MSLSRVLLSVVALLAIFAFNLSAASIPPPLFQPSVGNVEAPLRVTIRSTLPDAEIHITTDGSEPTARDVEIDSGDSVVIDHPLTLKAKAWLSDGSSSATQVCVYALRPAAGFASSFDDQSVPSFLAAGQTAKVSVSLRNIGAIRWTPGGHALTPRKTKDALIWGVSAVDLPSTTPSWGVATFDFTITAPTEPGTYNFQWRMRGPDGATFGEPAPLKRISVVTAAEYQQLLTKLGTEPGENRPSGNGPNPEESRKAKSSAAGQALPSTPLPAGITPGSELARVFRELSRSARSFRYLRSVGFNHSDAEFEMIVSRHKDLLAFTRIIRRDENGKRVIPGWPGAKLVRR